MSLNTAYGEWKRQLDSQDQNGEEYDSDDSYNGRYGESNSWWWTETGMGVRYAIVGALFAAILVFFVGGYYHGKRRIKQGKRPLAYHRWMIRSQPHPPARQRFYYANQDPNSQGYNMEGYPPPPPAYHHSEAPPPTYQPPDGATKAAPDQNYSEANRFGEGSGWGAPVPPPPAARP